MIITPCGPDTITTSSDDSPDDIFNSATKDGAIIDDITSISVEAEDVITISLTGEQLYSVQIMGENLGSVTIEYNDQQREMTGPIAEFTNFGDVGIDEVTITINSLDSDSDVIHVTIAACMPIQPSTVATPPGTSPPTVPTVAPTEFTVPPTEFTVPPTEFTVPPTESTTEIPCTCTEWTEWGNCTAACGVGQRLRSRECSCTGLQTDSEECNVEDCKCMFTADYFREVYGVAPPDGGVVGYYIESDGSPSDPYGTVSVDQEIVSLRTFLLNVAGDQTCGHCFCNADSELECVDEQCEEECEWTEWGTWSDCAETDSMACGVNTRNRTRVLLRPQVVGDLCCDGQPEETEVCDYEPCYEWGTWSSWTDCSAISGVGVLERHRQCFLDEDEVASDSKCGDYSVEAEPCYSDSDCGEENTYSCEGLDDDSSLCNKTCSDIRGETTCAMQELSCTGDICICGGDLVMNDNGECVSIDECSCRNSTGMLITTGSTEDISDICQTCTCQNGLMSCDDQNDCDNDCDYSDWSDWSRCSVLCGDGVRVRYRREVSARNDCEDDLMEAESCSEDCEECMHNNQTHEHMCTIYQNNCEFCYCDSGSVVCIPDEDNIVPGGWSEWSTWGNCSREDCEGVQRRTRQCNNPEPECADYCVGNATETMPCNEGEACDCEEPGCEHTCIDREICTSTIFECACEDGYVHDDDGNCIPTDLCPCYDENGTERTPGVTYTREGDECVIYACIDGVDTIVTNNRTQCSACPQGQTRIDTPVDPDNQCCDQCVEVDACRLHTDRRTITVPIEGVMCTSEWIDFSYCQGECSDNVTYSGEIYYENAVVQDSTTDCTCCTGTGDLVEYNVTCDGDVQPHPIRLRQMTGCVCEACGTESLAPSTSADSTVPDSPFIG